MSEKIGPYEIVERIDPDGYTCVYRAVENMGHGIQRYAALKVLQGVKTDDQESMDNLLREAGLLLEVSTSPNIVTVYSFGVDEKQGPWLAMELAGNSLKHFVSDVPADPDQVRLLLRDVLQALAVVHDKGILHRDLKPNNILSTVYGQWKVADFGLARQQASEDTMAMATVKYAAPEMLDSSLSAETPAMDLYSLGIVAYEFALGQTLFRQQFPSVYDPDAAHTRADDRPKWMYWHTSIQMTVPSVAELIPDFPKDLSDLIASLMAKQVRERVPSAMKGLVLLGEVRARIDLGEDDDDDARKSGKGSNVPMLSLALVLALLFVSVVGYVYFTLDDKPIITLVKDSGRYESNTAKVPVTGKIANVPKGGGVKIQLGDGTAFPVLVDGEGRFVSDVQVKKLGETTAQLLVTKPNGDAVMTRLLVLNRTAPDTVRLTITTSPRAENVEVTVTPASGAVPSKSKTDANGIVRLDVPYGDYTLEARHVCFKRVTMKEISGFDDVRDVKVWLESISRIRARQLRQAILDDFPEVVALANTGDAGAKERIAQMREEVRCLGTDGTDPAEEEMWKAIEGALDAAANGDLSAADAAIETIDEINKHRAAQLGGGTDDGSANARAKTPEQQLVDDTAALEAALARGDFAEAEKIANRILANTPDDGNPVNQAIRDQMAKVKEGIDRAKNGDASGLADARAAAKSASTTAILNNSGGDVDALPWAGGQGPGFDAIDQVTLLRLPAELLKAFIEVNVPRGAITVDVIPRMSKLRIRGVLFSDEEVATLEQRLAPAMLRLDMEVRADAWALCRRLSDRLESNGSTGVRVHAYVTAEEKLLYVIYPESMSVDEIRQTSLSYVLDPDLSVTVPMSASSP